MERIDGEPIGKGWEMQSQKLRKRIYWISWERYLRNWEPSRTRKRAGVCCWLWKAARLSNLRCGRRKGNRSLRERERRCSWEMGWRPHQRWKIRTKSWKPKSKVWSTLIGPGQNDIPKPFFTHADANPTNILVKGDRVVILRCQGSIPNIGNGQQQRISIVSKGGMRKFPISWHHGHRSSRWMTCGGRSSVIDHISMYILFL